MRDRLPSLAAVLLLLALGAVSAGAETELKIVTADGFVAFTADDRWTVIRMLTKPPVPAAIFQIPNAADAGTPDSTNLLIRFFDRASAAAREPFQDMKAPKADSAPQVESFESWTVTRQQGKQGSTEYSVLDGKRELPGFTVAVRLAWPHLDGNPADYDEQMNRIFRSFLHSVRQHIGPYEPQDGEVVRRPTN